MSATAKTRRETWLDWKTEGQRFEAGPPITRDELVEKVRALGFRVSSDDLRFWETSGILPSAVKRWHEGATRAVYPQWMVAAVVSLRDYQGKGLSLDEIAQRLRATFYRPSDGGAIEASAVYMGTELMGPALDTYADRYEHMSGDKVGSIRVILYGTDGKELRRQTIHRHPGHPPTDESPMIDD